MRLVLPATILLAGAVLALTSPAQAAKCVQVTFFDQNGAVIQTNPPLTIGLLLGGQPVLNGAGPMVYNSKKVGAPAPCPGKLVDSVRDLFNRSCPSEQRRNAAAKESRVDIATINKGCANMAEALADPKPQ